MKKLFQSLSALLLIATLSFGITSVNAKSTMKTYSSTKTSTTIQKEAPREAPVLLNEEIEEPTEITITRADNMGFGGEKIVAGVADVTAMEFSLTNDSDDDVLVSSVTLKGYGNVNDFLTFALFLNGTQQGSSQDLNEDGLAYFNNLNVTVPANGETTIDVIFDTDEEATIPGALQTTIVGVESTNTRTNEEATTIVRWGELSLENRLNGPYFRLIESGILNVARGNLISGGNLFEGTEVEVLEIELTAEDDDIMVGDFYLENDVNGDGVPDNTNIESRVDFKFYDEFGQFLAQERMTQGTLHFELSREDQIRVPEGGSAFITIIANVRSMTEEEHLGIPLRLSLDADGSQNNHKGIEAVTAATGSTINTPEEGWGDATGEIFTTARPSLDVERGNLIPGGNLVENETDVEILQIQLTAEDDEIRVRDFYLENDVDGDGEPDDTNIEHRVTFRLYNEAGQLIAADYMINGTLHFELSHQDSIRIAEDDSTFVTIKVDVRSLPREEHLGLPLVLALDADGSQNEHQGIQAVASTTGQDLPTPENGWGDAVSELFVTSR